MARVYKITRGGEAGNYSGACYFRHDYRGVSLAYKNCIDSHTPENGEVHWSLKNCGLLSVELASRLAPRMWRWPTKCVTFQKRH
jgi:hypothetical protein